MEEEDFTIYNNKVMKQDEVVDYKEVQEVEDKHLIDKPNQMKEIAIQMKPSECPLIPIADDNNYGTRSGEMPRRGQRMHPFNGTYWESF
jgi:hypothetical protein